MWSGLEVIPNLMTMFKALIKDRWCEQWSLTMTQDFPRLCNSSSHSQHSSPESPFAWAHGLQGIASNGNAQGISIQGILSTPANTSVDTFAIIHTSLECVEGCGRHLKMLYDVLPCVSCANKSRTLRSFILLERHFEVHNNI